MAKNPYLKLEKDIASGVSGDVIRRWRYGRRLIGDKAGRKQLPHGLAADLIKVTTKAGFKLTEREIQYRLKCAETYGSEAEVRTAVRTFGSWSALREAGFPAVDDAGSDPDEIEASGLGTAPDEWEQLDLDIPGLKPIISVRGRKIALVKGDEGATVADIAAYLDMCEQMHANFGKTVDQIRESLKTMREGAGGDDDANAVEAWERATGDDDEEPEEARP